MTSTNIASAIERHVPVREARTGGILHRLWRRYWDWRARQATVEILRRLDDRTLKDIGMCRHEIESFVHASRCERVRRYDAGWWR
jgi:uncharacterized protein YjiS (DUF1127 family)